MRIITNINWNPTIQQFVGIDGSTNRSVMIAKYVLKNHQSNIRRKGVLDHIIITLQVENFADIHTLDDIQRYAEEYYNNYGIQFHDICFDETFTWTEQEFDEICSIMNNAPMENK